MTEHTFPSSKLNYVYRQNACTTANKKLSEKYRFWLRSSDHIYKDVTTCTRCIKDMYASDCLFNCGVLRDNAESLLLFGYMAAKV